MIIAVLILCVLSAAWYLPVYKAQGREDKLKLRYYIIVFFLGMLAVPLSIVFAMPITKPIIALFHPEGFAKDIISCIFTAGVAEELAKFAVALVIIQMLRPVRKIDAILLCGISGVGFNILESMLKLSGIATAIMRGVSALHITTMFWTGGYWWESRKCKESGDKKGLIRNLLIGFLFPMAFHAIFDIVITYGSSLFAAYALNLEEAAEEITPDRNVIIGLVMNMLMIVLSLAFDVYSFKKARNTAVASQAGAEKV